jgi:hypothetical protein
MVLPFWTGLEWDKGGSELLSAFSSSVNVYRVEQGSLLA